MEEGSKKRMGWEKGKETQNFHKSPGLREAHACAYGVTVISVLTLILSSCSLIPKP
jgi:hypothetical protein